MIIFFSCSHTFPEDIMNLVRFLWVVIARDGLTVDHVQCTFCGIVSFIFQESALVRDIHTLYVSKMCMHMVYRIMLKDPTILDLHII